MNLKLWNDFSTNVINPFPPTTSQIGSVSFLSIAYIAAIQGSYVCLVNLLLSENKPPILTIWNTVHGLIQIWFQ